MSGAQALFMDNKATGALEYVMSWLRARAPATVHLCADSRALQAGDVYLSYTATEAEQRYYFSDAIKQGARAILWQPGQSDSAPIGLMEAEDFDVPTLAVPNLAELAGAIASDWYGAPSESLFVTGVTGTNGKTSCSYWIAQALSALGKPCALIGTLGSGLAGKWVPTGFTTPDAPQLQRSLAGMRSAGAQAVAMEVSSHGLHQGRVNGTAFDAAIFTNLTHDHLDYHRTFENYERANARLFDWPTLRHVIINCDDAAGARLLARAQGKVSTIAYGIEEGVAAPTLLEADGVLRAQEMRVTASGTAFKVISSWGRGEVMVPMLGAFNVSNLLAVLGALLAADVPFDVALAQLARLEPVIGRMQQLGGKITSNEPLVVVDYAHTPDALAQALRALRPIAATRKGRLICVFGCGGNRDTSKRGFMGRCAEQLADAVVLTSDNPRHEPAAAIIEDILRGMSEPARVARIEDRARAILRTIRTAAAEDVILLAGRGHETTRKYRARSINFLIRIMCGLRWRRV